MSFWALKKAQTDMVLNRERPQWFLLAQIETIGRFLPESHQLWDTGARQAPRMASLISKRNITSQLVCQQISHVQGVECLTLKSTGVVEAFSIECYKSRQLFAHLLPFIFTPRTLPWAKLSTSFSLVFIRIVTFLGSSSCPFSLSLMVKNDQSFFSGRRLRELVGASQKL